MPGIAPSRRIIALPSKRDEFCDLGWTIPEDLTGSSSHRLPNNRVFVEGFTRGVSNRKDRGIAVISIIRIIQGRIAVAAYRILAYHYQDAHFLFPKILIDH